MDVTTADIVLCEFYFSDLSATKKRPVLVLKDNLPHNDFVGLPISSQVEMVYPGECEIDNAAFRYGNLPKKSKLMLRKPFVVSKKMVVKKYGTLTDAGFSHYHLQFCQYFQCST